MPACEFDRLCTKSLMLKMMEVVVATEKNEEDAVIDSGYRLQRFVSYVVFRSLLYNSIHTT